MIMIMLSWKEMRARRSSEEHPAAMITQRGLLIFEAIIDAGLLIILDKRL